MFFVTKIYLAFSACCYLLQSIFTIPPPPPVYLPPLPRLSLSPAIRALHDPPPERPGTTPRRCVFTRAANEVRTTSAMTAEANRCNILATIVKEHQNARRCNDQSRRQKQPLDKINSAATTGPLASPSITSDRRKVKGALRGKELAKEKEVAKERPSLKEKEGFNDRRRSKAEGRGSPPKQPSPILPSINMSKMPSSGEIVAAGGDSTLPRSAGRKRPRTTRNAQLARHGGLLQVAASEECVVSRASFSVHGRDVPALGEGAPVAAGGIRGRSFQKKRSTRRVRRLGLPSISERYGARVMENWVQAPVALKLERPRCKSVAIAHLDQPAYRDYMEEISRVGAAQTRRRWQQSTRDDTDGVGQGVAGCWKGNTNEIGNLLANRQQGRTTVGWSSHLGSGCIAVAGGEHEDGGNGGHAIPGISSTTSPHPTGNDRNNLAGGRKADWREAGTAAVSGLAKSSHVVDRCGGGVQPRDFNSQHPPKILRAASYSKLRAGEKGAFGRTSCEVEKSLRHKENDERGEPGSTRLRTLTKAISRAPGHGSDSSAIPTADEVLTSEGLALHSKGARKVFKQTQRLLEALRTPAESCLYDPDTGARRNCGGGNIGGHSSIVVHYHQNHSGSVSATVGDTLHRGGGGDTKLTDPKFSDGGMWRAPRGNRSARLKEVLDRVAPPHTVRIECEIILHESLSRAGDGHDGNGGISGGGNGTWDDFVFAWEVRKQDERTRSMC